MEALSVGADRATTSLSLQTKSPGQGNVGSCFARWDTNREDDYSAPVGIRVHSRLCDYNGHCVAPVTSALGPDWLTGGHGESGRDGSGRVRSGRVGSDPSKRMDVTRADPTQPDGRNTLFGITASLHYRKGDTRGQLGVESCRPSKPTGYNTGSMEIRY